MGLFIDFIQWWYGAGWVNRVRLTGEHIQMWYEHFSFPILIRTLFSPWRQIISRPITDSGLQAKFSAMIDNVVSRSVGFWVRLTVMIAGLVMILLVLLINLVIFVIWPLLPLAPIVLVLAGFFA